MTLDSNPANTSPWQWPQLDSKRDYPRFELSAVELVRELREESLVAADRDRAGRRISIAKSARP
jgi:hypothetical protein